MTYVYLEPTKAPRHAEIMNIAARRRIITNARLATYRIPVPNDNVVGHRQLVSQKKRKPLEPYTSPVTEGLLALVEEQNNRGI